MRVALISDPIIPLTFDDQMKTQRCFNTDVARCVNVWGEASFYVGRPFLCSAEKCRVWSRTAYFCLHLSLCFTFALKLHTLPSPVKGGGGGRVDWKSNLNLFKCETRRFPTRKDASFLSEGWTALLPSFVLEIPRRHDKKIYVTFIGLRRCMSLLLISFSVQVESPLCLNAKSFSNHYY